MQGIINGETPFKVFKETFSVAPTTAGYTLNYATSKDGAWTAYTEATPAGEMLIVNGVTPFTWFKLAGNVDNNVEVVL